jgi:hypothetical protein
MRTIQLILSFVVAAAALGAQERSRYEVAGAYSYTGANLGPDIGKAALSGWDASFTYRPLPFLGATARATGGYGAPTVDGIAVHTSFHSLLFGPQVRWPRSRRYTPFAYALFGVCRVWGRPEGIADAAEAGWSRAWAFGGGLDVRLGRRLAVRPFQAEYFATHSTLLLGAAQQHYRFSTGIVFYPWSGK